MLKKEVYEFCVEKNGNVTVICASCKHKQECDKKFPVKLIKEN